MFGLVAGFREGGCSAIFLFSCYGDHGSWIFLGFSIRTYSF